MKKEVNGGQSLFEVVIAIGVVALVLVGAVSLATASVRNTDFSKNNALATKFAQEGSEYLRAKRDEDWHSYVTTYVINAGFINLGANFSTGTASINNIFTRRIRTVCGYYNESTGTTTSPYLCTQPEVNIVNSYVTVNWTDAQGTHTVTDSTTLTRWRN